MKNKIILSLLIFCSIIFTCCTSEDYPETANLPKATNLQYTVNKRAVSLTWEAPAGVEVKGYQVIQNNTDVFLVEGNVTEYFIKRAEVNKEICYTVKAIYADNKVSEGVTVRFTIPAVKAKKGYLINYNSVAEIEDDDEKAAAEWFMKNVEDAAILTPKDLEGITPDDYSMIWIQIDRVGLNFGYQNLPAELISESTLAALKSYYKEGGNFLLTKFATQMVAPMGRIDMKYAPGIFGSGAGAEGFDIWTTNAVIGVGFPTFYDHRGHPIYKDLETSNAFPHETFPLEGPGWREDHNCMWDMNAYGFSGDANVCVSFEKATKSIVLGTWGHVQDYCCAGIVEFLPTDEYLGRCVAIGLSAYEWNQNSRVNQFQANTELLTKNCINYLAK